MEYSDYVLIVKTLYNWVAMLLSRLFSSGIIGQYIVFVPILLCFAKAVVSIFIGKSDDERG